MNRTRESLTSSDPKGSKRRLCRRPPLLLSFLFNSHSFALPLAQHRSLWAEDRTFQSGPIWVGQPKTQSRNSARGFFWRHVQGAAGHEMERSSRRGPGRAGSPQEGAVVWEEDDG